MDPVRTSGAPGTLLAKARAWRLALLLATRAGLMAHDLHPAALGPDDPGVPDLPILLGLAGDPPPPSAPAPGDVGTPWDAVRTLVESFVLFRPAVRFRWDATHFFVEGDGIPDHGMMAGITAWQQQVPLPTYYFGTNAWRIPLDPVPAASPQRITPTTFTRGAIALAANGIPIFNPYNNRGEPSALIGELDAWGGHCGRADDYHYHVAPLHLTNILGHSRPLAFALDGYPVYGLSEPDGSAVSGLDSLNGHTNVLGRYHYHASTNLPYLNAGFHGTVTYADGQVSPQPTVRPVRPSGTPLNGATLLALDKVAPDRFSLRYRLAGNPTDFLWNYSLDRSRRAVEVTYIGPTGTTQATYPNWQPAPPAVTPALAASAPSTDPLRLQGSGEAGHGYQLQGSTDLVEWTHLVDVLLDGEGHVLRDVPANGPRSFFRLR